MWLAAMLFLVPGVPEIICEAPLQNGGTCRIIQAETGEYTAILQVEYLNGAGDLLWSAYALPVRPDARAASVTESDGGEILAACSFGQGYTDVLLKLFDSSGNPLSADTIALDCYDTPQALVAAGEGYVLAWDSWSDQRGVHLAFIDCRGKVRNTRFVSETVNPGPVALTASEDVLVLGLSPLLARGDILFFYSAEGESLNAQRPVLPSAAELIESAVIFGGDSLEITWESLPDSDGTIIETVSRHCVPASGV